MPKSTNTKVSLAPGRSSRNCSVRDLASWISKHRPDLNLRDLAPHLESLTLAASDVNGALNVYGMPQFRELFDMLGEFIGWMKSLPYTVRFNNFTSIRFDEIVWTYQTRDGFVLLQSTGEIPAGSSSELGSDSCLDIVQYAYSIWVNGEEAYRSDAVTLSVIDNPHAKRWGASAICEDVWDIDEA